MKEYDALHFYIAFASVPLYSMLKISIHLCTATLKRIFSVLIFMEVKNECIYFVTINNSICWFNKI